VSNVPDLAKLYLSIVPRQIDVKDTRNKQTQFKTQTKKETYQNVYFFIYSTVHYD